MGQDKPLSENNFNNSGNDEGESGGLSPIELNFVIVGGLFAAVLMLGIINVIIHFIDKAKNRSETSMSTMGERLRARSTVGGGQASRTKSSMFF